MQEILARLMRGPISKLKRWRWSSNSMVLRGSWHGQSTRQCWSAVTTEPMTMAIIEPEVTYGGWRIAWLLYCLTTGTWMWGTRQPGMSKTIRKIIPSSTACCFSHILLLVIRICSFPARSRILNPTWFDELRDGQRKSRAACPRHTQV